MTIYIYIMTLILGELQMDKASIIGDAVLYVQELQMQATKLKADIASLESSLIGSDRYQGSSRDPKNLQNTSNNHPIRKKIIKVCLIMILYFD